MPGPSRPIATLSRTTCASLLSALRDPDAHGAWHEFHARYRQLIHGFARRRGLSEADCEDVVQTVLAALVRAMPRFRYEPRRGRFRGYLKTAVLHEIHRIDRRERGRTGLREDEEAMDHRRIDDEWETQWRDHHVARALRRIDHEFSEANVAAFRHHALAGQPAETTARLLGISVHQVYKAKTRITSRMKDIIADQVAAEG